jgi:hypothetical protein
MRNMQESLSNLRHEVPVEFFNWQAEDVHRAAPWLKRTGRKGSRVKNRHYVTIFRPHSGKSMDYRKRVRPRTKKARLRRRRHGVTGPILRPMLSDELMARLSALLDKVKW